MDKDFYPKLAWETYRRAMKCPAYEIDPAPLPGWEELLTDETKVKIAEAWRATAKAVVMEASLQAGEALVEDLEEVVDRLRTELENERAYLEAN